MGRILLVLSISSFWLDGIIMMSPALQTDAVLTSPELLAIVVGVAFIGLGGVRLVFSSFSLFKYFLSATRPIFLFRDGIVILVTALLCFFT